MIQNRIILFLRKALITFPFLLGLLFLVTPEIGLSAAIETTEFDIDPFPSQPVESDSLFLNITETGSCFF